MSQAMQGQPRGLRDPNIGRWRDLLVRLPRVPMFSLFAFHIAKSWTHASSYVYLLMFSPPPALRCPGGEPHQIARCLSRRMVDLLTIQSIVALAPRFHYIGCRDIIPLSWPNKSHKDTI